MRGVVDAVNLSSAAARGALAGAAHDVLALLPVTRLQSDDDELGLALLLQTCSKAIEAAQRDVDKMAFKQEITAV
jgi:hypothetical protein